MSVFFVFLRFVCGVGLFCHCSAGGVRLVGVLSLSPVATAFNWFSCPLSPRPRSQSALPLWGRGRFIVILCKGLRPRHPGLNLRGTGLSRCSDCLGWHFPWNRHKRRPNNRFIREKFWGVWGTLSRVPQRFPQRFPRFPRFPHFRDSQGLFLENILLF